MRKYLFAWTFVLSGYVSIGQDLHLSLSGGLMNYQGDLQGKRITFDQANPYFGIGAYYELTDKIFIRAGVISGKVGAHDKYSQLNSSRNLSFTSQVTEFHFGLEYDLIKSAEHTLTPYLYAALAGFHFNPYAMDADGQKVYLQPLGTEGQGFVPGREKYALTQLAIPFGGGLKIAINENVFVRVEAVMRKLFTDYLDDVSATYADQTSLLRNNGQAAVNLAFRGSEINPVLTYPAEGRVRGNPKSKDFYYTAGVSVSFRLTGNEYRAGNGKGKLGCPMNVY